MIDGHILSIGISAYPSLPLPEVHDAEDIHAVFSDPQMGGFSGDQIPPLLDSAATRTGILSALEALCKRTTTKSQVVVYFSGHGERIVAGPDAGAYLLPFDVRADGDAALAASAISAQVLADKLREIPAANLTVILDCCRAAGLAEAKALRPLIPINADGLSALSVGRSRTVLAASPGAGYAWVVPGERNGVFTGYLLEGLRGAAGGVGGVIRVCDLYDYVQRKTAERFPTQRPIFKAELEENYVLARYRGGEVPPLVVPPVMDSYAYDAFVIYRQKSKEDRDWVKHVLVKRLEGAGLKLCLEDRDFRPGAYRIDEMVHAVEKSRYTVAVLTPELIAGNFEGFQTKLAQTLSVDTNVPRFLPLLRKDCRLSLDLQTLAQLDVTDETDEVDATLQRLIVALRQSPLQPGR